ncbi:MAG: hypothetical protein EAZ36_05370 [Verrucomicrobia bacterium]|nr:MAG: hypothetical protein EAZ36_05370 [Verrucomicrobiota bacterium]
MRSICLGYLGFAFAFSGVTQVQAAITIERSVGEARIVRIAPLPQADLIVLNAGFDAGFRQGMVCSVARSGEKVGELILVDLSSRQSTALILDLTSREGLQPGDAVAVKTVSSR